MTTNTIEIEDIHLAKIAAFGAIGEIELLEESLSHALDQGLTINQLQEVCIQLYAYAGFPRSLNCLSTLMKVIEGRKQSGRVDELGELPKTIPENNSKYVLGAKIQTAVVGVEVVPKPNTVFGFAPAIDVFLKEHLFADVFYRGVLNYQQREIATIAALFALGNVKEQLYSHFFAGLNVGLTHDRLNNILATLDSALHRSNAESGLTLFNEFLSKQKP